MTATNDAPQRPSDTAFPVGDAPLPEVISGFADFGHIPCKGLPNTRDLGGMPTADGRRIKAGRLIRSGALHHATDDDLRGLESAHGLMRVVDFRTELERSHDPDPKDRMRSGTEFYDLPVFQSEALGITRGQGIASDLKVFAQYNGGPYDAVEALYPKALLGEEGVAAYRSFLQLLLASDEGSTLWHCTEGKDRTGLAALLVETILGVPEASVRADYLATNIFARTRAERALDALAQHRVARDLDADVDALFYAYPAYLDAALAAVTERYGSLLAYVSEELGVDEADQRALREMYLED